MSTKLNYGIYDPYRTGLSVKGGDLLNSGKWNYAARKFVDMDKSQVNDVFSYYQNNPYTNASRYAFGMTRPNPTEFEKSKYKDNPFTAWKPTNPRTPFAKQGFGDDPFKGMRLDAFKQGKMNFRQEGDSIFYDRYKAKDGGDIYRTQYQNPFSNQWQDTPFSSPNMRNARSRQVLRDMSELDTETVSGRLLNNAYVGDDAYENMTDADKQVYGLRRDQAFQLDPRLAGAQQLVDAAHEYRRGRSRKKTGMSLAGSIAAPIIGGVGLGLATGGLASQYGLSNSLTAGLQGAGKTYLQGGDFSDALTAGAKGYVGGVSGALDKAGQFSDQLQNTTQGSEGMRIFDFLKKGANQVGNFFGGTPGINPAGYGGQDWGIGGDWGNIYNPTGGSSGGNIFSNLNKFLSSDLGQFGIGAAGMYLRDRESDQFGNRASNAAQSTQFRPYGVTGPGGGVTFDGNNINTHMSPAMQALADRYLQSAMGNVDAFNSYDPNEMAAEQFDILEGIAQPYRDRDRNSLMSQMINQGVYNPGATQQSPGYWQPRMLEDAIESSRMGNLYQSYGLAQDTATNTMNRGLAATNSLNALNYGPLDYANVGGNFGSARSQGNSRGIPYLMQAAGMDAKVDGDIYNSIFDVLRNRRGYI